MSRRLVTSVRVAKTVLLVNRACVPKGGCDENGENDEVAFKPEEKGFAAQSDENGGRRAGKAMVYQKHGFLLPDSGGWTGSGYRIASRLRLFERSRPELR